jgi:Exo-beta-D-glucosaminidase Ig-fold domain/Glycosyl hydrolases family 2/Glycosyl hydrolases family 2, TIM barrel domain
MSSKTKMSGFLRLILTASFFVSFYNQAISQNVGLSKPQDPAELPKSRAAVIQAKVLPKIEEETRLVRTSENEWIIAGGWELVAARKINAKGIEISRSEFNTDLWMNATVPGTILTSLVNQGYYPDPLYGLNNLSVPDTLCRTDWWYRNIIPLPPASENKRVRLLLNGINYIAEVWLNGSKIGTISGAFIRGQFDITSDLNRKGINVLAIHIFPPPHPGIPHEENLKEVGPNGGVLCYDGPTFVCTEGWDWIPGIRDRNMGIWQDVRLSVTSDAQIEDPQVITDLPLPDTSSAKIEIKTSLINKSGVRKTFVLAGDIETISFSKRVTLYPGENKLIVFSSGEFPQLNFRNPRLWWPNGYGKQELYTLKLKASDAEGLVSDEKEIRFGIREMSYDFTVDYQWARKNVRVNLNPLKVWKKTDKIITYRLRSYETRRLPNGVQIGIVPDLKDTILLDKGITPGSSPYLVIQVNGQPIYCRGGNWGLDEAMKRVSRDKMEPFFRLHKDAGFTMIRNWVGQSTEEVFYELADEYGLLIWNDFWMSTENYNVDPWNNQLFMNNARDVIRRYRNHPSIALWCGRNEGNPPLSLDDSLQILQAREDGTRIFHSSSIMNNLTNSGPWFYGDFVKKEIHHKEGFNTETGAPAIPVSETIKEMMPESDLWPIGDTWYYHDLHNGQKDYIKAIEDQYGSYKNLNEFCLKAQLLNYEIYREIFEVWNYRLWNTCSGLLLWMSHPAWPSTVWQTYSSDYETNGVFYGAAKACEPLHIQFQPDTYNIYFINNTLTGYSGIRTELKIWDLGAREIFSKSAVDNSKANSSVKCFVPELPGNLPNVFIARLRTFSSGGALLSENTYFRTNDGKKDFRALNNLKQTKITGKLIVKKMTGKLETFRLSVTNPGKVVAVSIKLNVRDGVTGKRILPAYISDGYFTLLPGETRAVTAECPAGKLPGELKITAEGLNVPLQDIITIK